MRPPEEAVICTAHFDPTSQVYCCPPAELSSVKSQVALGPQLPQKPEPEKCALQVVPPLQSSVPLTCASQEAAAQVLNIAPLGLDTQLAPGAQSCVAAAQGERKTEGSAIPTQNPAGPPPTPLLLEEATDDDATDEDEDAPPKPEDELEEPETPLEEVLEVDVEDEELDAATLELALLEALLLDELDTLDSPPEPELAPAASLEPFAQPTKPATSNAPTIAATSTRPSFFIRPPSERA